MYMKIYKDILGLKKSNKAHSKATNHIHSQYWIGSPFSWLRYTSLKFVCCTCSFHYEDPGSMPGMKKLICFEKPAMTYTYRI